MRKLRELVEQSDDALAQRIRHGSLSHRLHEAELECEQTERAFVPALSTYAGMNKLMQ